MLILPNYSLCWKLVFLTRRWRRSCSFERSHLSQNRNQRRHSGIHQGGGWQQSRRSSHQAGQASRQLPVAPSLQSYRWWSGSYASPLTRETWSYTRRQQPFPTKRLPSAWIANKKLSILFIWIECLWAKSVFIILSFAFKLPM